MYVTAKMKVAETEYEADDPRGQRDDIHLEVEDVRVTLYNGITGRNGQFQDASKYRDPVCYEDIRLFKDELVLKDIPYTFDCDNLFSAEMRIENVKKVTLNKI